MKNQLFLIALTLLVFSCDNKGYQQMKAQRAADEARAQDSIKREQDSIKQGLQTYDSIRAVLKVEPLKQGLKTLKSLSV